MIRYQKGFSEILLLFAIVPILFTAFLLTVNFILNKIPPEPVLPKRGPAPVVPSYSIFPAIGPEISMEEKTKIYCSEIKPRPGDADSLFSLQLICADLCAKDKDFKESHQEICAPISRKTEGIIIE